MTRPATALSTALARGPLVLDGGLSNQLEAAHEAYVRAGARVLITASYQASFEGFARAGVGGREASELFRRSVELARRAAERCGAGEDVWVAGSVGPYGAVRADGGEYRGGYGLSVRELAAFHRPRIEALAEAEPDVLALETVPDAVEVEALLRAAAGCGVPVWLSCTIAGDRTRAGQPLEEAFAPAAGQDQVLAVGVNCCAPGDAERAVGTAAAVTGKPVVVYPNSGEEWSPAPGRAWHGPRSWSAELAAGWVERGARLVGGCCRVGPDLIADLAREPAMQADGRAASDD